MTNQSDNWLRFGALKEKNENFYGVASILMPLSKAETKHGINFDAAERFFYPAPIKTGLLIPYLVRGFTNFLPEGLIFPLSRDLPLEEDKTIFGSMPYKTEHFSHYLMRGFEIFLPKDLIFRPSRDLPLEGAKFSARLPKHPPELTSKWSGFSGTSDSLTRQGGDNHPTTE